MHTKKGCHRFYPHDFSRDGKIKLDKEAKLGEEMMLVCDEEEIKREYGWMM
jgi:hypothetical protein